MGDYDLAFVLMEEGCVVVMMFSFSGFGKDGIYIQCMMEFFNGSGEMDV